MLTINNAPASISLKKIGGEISIPWDKMPQASLEHIFTYGIRQILNDAMAASKTAPEALGAANKRLDNLLNDNLRGSPVREGNPVRKRALELAFAKIVKNAAFIASCQKAGIKVTHKDAVKKANEIARTWIAKEGNQYMVQAAIDVEAAKALESDDMDLDFDFAAEDVTGETETDETEDAEGE